MTENIQHPPNPPTLAYAHNFCRITGIEDRQVALAYDLDFQRWPWLSLPAQHPVLLEKYQYFSSLTAGCATGAILPDKFTALTKIDWRCPGAVTPSAYATLGLCTSTPTGFELSIANDAGETVARYVGEGTVFADRDFKAWRQAARDKALAAGVGAEMDYAPAETVGLARGGISFISRLQAHDGQSWAMALVTHDKGFTPTHPYHTGSGDHVNAAHLVDCALQATYLVLDAHGLLTCIGGSAEFRRFVELDVPFVVELISQDTLEQEIIMAFNMKQLDRDCARINLHFGNKDFTA